jgi:hypothetical protein
MIDRRHIQKIGAALSRRDWQATEAAYNELRDEFDAALPPQGELREAITSLLNEYTALLDKGKGEHGKASYVTDDTWARWNGAYSILAKLAALAGRTAG